MINFLYVCLQRLKGMLNLPMAPFCRRCGRNVHAFIATYEVWALLDPDCLRPNSEKISQIIPLFFYKGTHMFCYDCFCEARHEKGLPSIGQICTDYARMTQKKMGTFRVNA